ncbi:chromatin remodeling-related protein [Kockovaella imperatae]|uniref:Chromatin remodeling-related protein n=1 Tax=Kockovaella imperatae TaxID=4999 RepID=A0A1Y1UJP4_9TREE|nr:chromatin remodeling-related protein [Kockovaella imperatae]ORX37757.1 chromatin remodeling-related protein [Kockovaella imperatae]
MASVAGPSQPPVNPTSSAVSANDAKRRADEQNAPRKHARLPLPPPHILAALVPDSPAFTELMKIEQNLDWTLLRKKAELNDALGRPTRIKRTLRVFVSNTAHDQPWQQELAQSAESDAANINAGKGIPGWVLRVEGRLLDTGNVRLDKTKRKFSSFIRSAVIEMDDRTAPTFPEGNVAEWRPRNLQPPLDGFEVSRKGDVNVNCRILLHIEHSPDRFSVLSPLSDLIATKEGTKSEIMGAIWKLIKMVGAQDKEDGTIVRPVGGFEKIIGKDGIAFHKLPEVVGRFLAHPDPVVIPYTIRVDQDFHLSPKCFDIPVETEDPMKSKMASIVSAFEGQEGKEVAAIEDKVGELAYFARDLKQKRDFLESFSTDPHGFIQSWLAAQARDLDQMLGYQVGHGPNGGSVREEDLRRSDLFHMPWVDEAVTIHEATRLEREKRQ